VEANRKFPPAAACWQSNVQATEEPDGTVTDGRVVSPVPDFWRYCLGAAELDVGATAEELHADAATAANAMPTAGARILEDRERHLASLLLV
jgi:hypothetical protein